MDHRTLENLHVDSLVSPLFLKDVHVNRKNVIKNKKVPEPDERWRAAGLSQVKRL